MGGITILTVVFTKSVLPKVIQSEHEQCPMAGTSKNLLLQDKASPIKTKVTESYLQQQDIQVLGHYSSPDLAPCDF